MIHARGGLAVARLLKEIHPELPIVFGGISSTYYAPELVAYPFADMVTRKIDGAVAFPSGRAVGADSTRFCLLPASPNPAGG